MNREVILIAVRDDNDIVQKINVKDDDELMDATAELGQKHFQVLVIESREVLKSIKEKLANKTLEG